MEPKTRKRIDAVLEEANELTAAGMDEFKAARQSLTAQTTDVLRELAVAAIVDAVRRRQRAAALATERQAERDSAPLSEQVASPFVRPRKGTKAFDRWVATTPEGREWQAQEDTYHADLMRVWGDGFRQMRDLLRMEWTSELLSSDFALADGTRVTWGDATAEQHRERAGLFERNAIANAEGAARHLHALEALEQSGAETLNAMVGVAA